MSQKRTLNGPADSTSPVVDDASIVQNTGSDDEMTSFLTQLFALMREPWARDFLFKMDAMADVSALSSPSQLQYGMVVEMMLSIFETNEQYGGMFDLDVNCRWLIVPVFSVGDISAEVIVQARKTVSNTTVGSANGNASNIRMIRSDRNGDLLFSVDDEEAGQINISLFRNDSTTKRKRLWVRANREPFLKAMLGSAEIDFKKLHQSITLTIDFNEVRCCPICSTPPGARCRCKFTYNLPKHPMDFSFSRSNMIFHRGHFTGIAKMTLFMSGVQLAQGILSVSTNIETTNDPGSVNSLVEWGIQKKMQAVSVVPRPGLSPVRLRDDWMSFCTIPGLSPSLRRDDMLDSVEVDSVFPWYDGPASIMRSAKVSSQNFSPQALANDGLGFLPNTDFFLERMEKGSLTHSIQLDAGSNNVLRIQSAAARQSASAHGNAARVEDMKEFPSQEAGHEEKANDPKLLRRIKNRESAARSNLRRKERNDALKQNLAEIVKREKQLRKREEELKAENAKLRSQVHGS